VSSEGFFFASQDSDVIIDRIIYTVANVIVRRFPGLGPPMQLMLTLTPSYPDPGVFHSACFGCTCMPCSRLFGLASQSLGRSGMELFVELDDSRELLVAF
jgi:hypothetical protein